MNIIYQSFIKILLFFSNFFFILYPYFYFTTYMYYLQKTLPKHKF